MSIDCEKALVGSIQKFSIEDGPGIRTTVFFKGCPLECKWCHNPEMIDPKQQLINSGKKCIGCGYCIEVCPNGALYHDPEMGLIIDRNKCDMCLKCADECYAQALRPVARSMSVDEIMDLAEQDKGFYENTGGGITVSGGEILMQYDFIEKIIDEAANRGINVCLDTCGHGDPDALMRLALKENVTNILYDMKSIDDEVHKAYTGVGNGLILENLKMLSGNDVTREKLIMRMPLIQGVNDTDDIIKRTGELYKEIGIKRVNLLPYHNLGISKMKNIGGKQEEFSQPAEERLTEIQEYFKNEIGLEADILGRV